MSDSYLASKLLKPTEDVIIIDDEQSVIDVLQMYCENLGCFRNIITALDGSIAAKKLINQKFSLILLDVNMPKRKGDDLIRELNHGNSLNTADAVCVVSGNIDKTFLTEALEQGVKHYMVKPFTEEQFQVKAEQILKVTAPELFIED